MHTLATLDLEPPVTLHGLTVESILKLESGLQKAWALCRCYSPYCYTSRDQAPGGAGWDGRHDGRYFVLTSDGIDEWAIVECHHHRNGDFALFRLKTVFPLEPKDLWNRIRTEGFLVKWERLHLEIEWEPELGRILKLLTKYRVYGPGPEASVLIEAIVDSKWADPGGYIPQIPR